MSHTIGTFHPATGHGFNDVREIQVNRDDKGVYLWLNTDKGTILLRDRALLDNVTACLRRVGFGARQGDLL